jgi:hypothetical protein
LTYLEERTNNYMGNIQSVAEEKRYALLNYFGDVNDYVQLSRQQMNLNPDSQIPEFPQLENYLENKVGEKDLDLDGSPERVDVDDQDSRVQVTHHRDRQDRAKASIRDRLHSAKSEANHTITERQNNKEMEMFKAPIYS